MCEVGVSSCHDTNSFKLSFQAMKFPLPSAITFEGLFQEHFFQTGCEKTKDFAVNFNTYTSKDPITQKIEYYLGIGLNSKYDGEGIKELKRCPLNLVIALDISGSMFSPMEKRRSKLKVAIESLLILLSHLRPEDSLGLVVYNTTAKVLFPLTRISALDLGIVRKKIMSLEANGGTNLEAGIVSATSLFESANLINGEGGVEGIDLENRIMFFTDMIPNIGTTDGKKLCEITTRNSNRKLFTTFIGIGVDFDTSLVQVVTNTKGCNYLSVLSKEDFKKTMSKDFEYIVTPIAFNSTVNLSSSSFKIDRVYGSPGYEFPIDGKLLTIHSLFPSQKENENFTKGGVVLVKLSPIISGDLPPGDVFEPIHLTMQYEDRRGQLITSTFEITNPFSPSKETTEKDTENISVEAIRKAVFLVRYANLVNCFLTDIRLQSNDRSDYLINDKSGINYDWWRLSRDVDKNLIDFDVVDYYKKYFGIFIEEIQMETQFFGDHSFDEYLNVIIKFNSFSGRKKIQRKKLTDSNEPCGI